MVHGEPELVPGRAFIILGSHGIDLQKRVSNLYSRKEIGNHAYLFQRSVGESQHVDHANNLARFIHNGQIQVMAIWLVVSPQIEFVRRELEHTVHLAQSRLDAHIGRREIRMRSHHTNNTAGGGVKTRRNHSQDDILAGEDTRDRPLILNK